MNLLLECASQRRVEDAEEPAEGRFGAVLRVRMLGGFDIVSADGATIDITGRKPRALVALLARRPDRLVSRETLAAQLWPDVSPAKAKTSLRQALKQIRRKLGTSADRQTIRSEGNDLIFCPECAEVDVAVFEQLCDQGTAESLEAAAVLYRGDLLDGLPPPTDAVAEWMMFERSVLRERAAGALSKLAEFHSSSGRSDHAIPAALRLLALDPLQEPIHRLLMRLYAGHGRRGDAIAQYTLCRDMLARELGVEPEPETEQLYRSLRKSKTTQSRTSTGEPVVSVGPFSNLAGTPDEKHFARGLAEDLLAALARWRSFPVVPGPSEIARYTLEGSIRRQRQNIRVTASLADRETGVRLWSDRYDRELSDIFEIQDEITLRVASTVAPALSLIELDRTRAKRPGDLGAWELVIRAMAKMQERTRESVILARELFARAIAIHPDYAEAHAGLAMSYNIGILIGEMTDRTDAATKARTAARRAVALDAASAIAHRELSTAYQWLNRIDEALAEIRIAVELNPYDAVGLHQLGNKSDLAGDPRGLGYMKRAHELNPLEVRVQTRLTFLARAYLNAGEFGKAEEAARHAVALDESYVPARYMLALALGQLGRIAEGREALAQCKYLQPEFLDERRDWAPYRDSASNARLRDALRRLES